MKRKFKFFATAFMAAGLIVGWNIQNKQVVDALIGTNTLASRDSSGTKGNGDSYSGDLSLDGRYVVFTSSATNLISGDTNSKRDIFLKDTFTNSITRVSVDSTGTQSNDHSSDPRISGNGRYVVFSSDATNLVANDTNGKTDIFRYNTTTGTTELVSKDASGNLANNGNSYPELDAEGRFIVFVSGSTNFTTGDTNGDYDILLKDMNAGTITYISQSDSGAIGNTPSSGRPKISCDGRFITFSSGASNLVSSDTNGYSDVFLTDMLGTRTISNITSGGNNASYSADISCEGDYVLYSSSATNQISGDTNGVGDAFRYERSTGTKARVSLREDGSQTLQTTGGMAISADGKYVLFTSTGTNALTTTTSNYTDYNTTSLLLRDMSNNNVKTVNVKSNLQTDYSGMWSTASFSGANKVAFDSKGHSLVSDDGNGIIDVFTVDLGPANTCIVK